MAQAVVSNISYKGYDIDFNVYGQNEYTVWFEGDDIYFRSLNEAMDFLQAQVVKTTHTTIRYTKISRLCI